MKRSTIFSKLLERLNDTVFGTKAAAIVFLMTFVAYSYSLHRYGFWGVNSRLALTYAIVEEGTFCIDNYIDHPHYSTKDRAFYDGHYYSDKIIGLSLLAVPVHWVMYHAGKLIGRDPKPVISRYVITIVVVSLSSSLLAVVLLRFLLMLGQSLRLACIIVLFFAFGTMLFPFSSLFYAYLPSLFFLITAWFLGVRWKRNGTIDGRPVWLAGGLVGLALLCEYTITIPASLISLYYLFSMKRRLRFLFYLLGVSIPLSIFAIYNWICFDNPFALPYVYLDYSEFRSGMGQGLMGVGRFQWYVLYLITIHPYRGIFFYSPFLFLTVVSLARALKSDHRDDRWLAVTIISTILFYLALNASYYMWWGGGTLLARHLTPMLAFMAIAFAWFPRRLVPCLIILGVISVVLTGTQSVVDPHFEPFYNNTDLYAPWDTVQETGKGFVPPYLRHSLPEFLRGRISMNLFNRETYATDGKHWTLLPLLFVEFGLLVCLWRTMKGEKR